METAIETASGERYLLMAPEAMSEDDMSTFFGLCFEAKFSEERWGDAAARIRRYGYSGLASKEILTEIPEDSTGLLVTKAGRIFATAAYAQRSDVVYVWGLYVLPDQQRKGMGRAIMQHIAARVDSSLTLEVFVLKNDTGASDFYRAIGLEFDREIVGEVCRGVPAPMDVYGGKLSSVRAGRPNGRPDA